MKKVKWENGILLNCNHFIKNNDFTEDYIDSSRLNYVGVQYGIINLSLDTLLLKSGIVSIISFEAISEHGRYFKYSSNTENKPLYIDLSEHQNSNNFIKVYVYTTTQTDRLDDIMIEKNIYEISTEPNQLDNDYMHILTVTVDNNLEWKLSNESSPVLLSISNYLFLHTRDNIVEILLTLSNVYHQYSSIASNKNILSSIYVIENLIDQISLNQLLHPYILFEKMYELLVLICIERDKQVVKVAFDHINTLDAFKKIIEAIKNILDNENINKNFVMFDKIEKNEYICVIDREIYKKYQRMYFIVHKQNESDRVDLKQLKITATSRSIIVKNMHLSGTRLEKVSSSTLDLPGNPFLYNIYLMKNCQELEYILDDSSAQLSLYESLDHYKFYIYYN